MSDWLVPQWRWFALGTAFSAVTAAAAYGYAQIVKLAIDWLNTSDPRVFTVAPLAIMALVFVRAPSSYGQTQANNTGVQRAMIQLQDALFGSLIEGDFARLQASASGEYVSQFTNDMGADPGSVAAPRNKPREICAHDPRKHHLHADDGLGAHAAAGGCLSHRLLARRSPRRAHPQDIAPVAGAGRRS